jgi:hypothetical protein
VWTVAAMPTYSIDFYGLTPLHIDAVCSRLAANSRLGETECLAVQREPNAERITVLVNEEACPLIAFDLNGIYQDPAREYIQTIVADVPYSGSPWQKRICCVDGN